MFQVVQYIYRKSILDPDTATRDRYIPISNTRILDYVSG